jgi:hypothetical protein
MTKSIALFVLLVYFQVLSGQETDNSVYLQRPSQISSLEMNRLLDSLSLQKLNSGFIDNNLNSLRTGISKSNFDSSKYRSADSIRMQILFGSYSDFKRKFLALDLKDEIPDTHLPKIKGSIYKLNDPDYIGTVSFSVGSPISFFYNKFSKQEQELQKYLAIKAYEPCRKTIDSKYNTEKVQYWTGLQGESLTKFVLFCHFEDDYLLKVADYELIKMVLLKLTEFKAIEDSCNFEQ